ncbi:MAG: phosphatase PAP2 family protein [Chloroflexi bacterium]|nr:phosphatase PAP2 family protein [Chloroflexota bacterium]
MTPRPIRRDPWPWVVLACALAFLVLGTLVVRRGGLAFDEPLAAALQGLPVPVGIWEACTFLGGAILIPIGVALVLAAALSRRVRLAIIVALVLVIAAAFTEVVKELVARPRPTANPLVSASGYSFPSGHSLNSTVTFGILALIAWRSRLSLAVRRAVPVVAVMLPVLIGLSRIALGVHWPTDVLAGWLAGVAFVALAATFVRQTRALERELPGPAARVPASEP